VSVRESIQRATIKQGRASAPQPASPVDAAAQAASYAAKLALIRQANSASHARIDAIAAAAQTRIRQLARKP
jgi:hypothetical protein